MLPMTSPTNDQYLDERAVSYLPEGIPSMFVNGGSIRHS